MIPTVETLWIIQVVAFHPNLFLPYKVVEILPFNGSMGGDNIPKGSNTNAENCGNCVFVMFSG